MPLQVQLADEEDIPRAVEIEGVAYGPNPLAQAIFPGPFPDGGDDSRVQSLIKQIQTDAACRCLKVVDTDLTEQPMVAFAMWFFWTSPHYGATTPSRTYGPGCNREACELFFGSMTQRKDELMDGKPYAYLKLLHTHPDHKKRGAGSLLLQWGIEEADRLGLCAFLESSPAGLSLYQKFGFNIVDTVKVDLSPYGGPEKVETPLMLRDAK